MRFIRTDLGYIFDTNKTKVFIKDNMVSNGKSEFYGQLVNASNSIGDMIQITDLVNVKLFGTWKNVEITENNIEKVRAVSDLIKEIRFKVYDGCWEIAYERGK